MSILDTLTKSLVELYSKQLNESQQEEVLAALEVLADDVKYNKFQNMFPAEGEFSVDKYPKHKRFFDAGRQYKERGFIAGNRCFTPWSYIQTESGPTPALEVLTSQDSTVLSWDGKAQCIRKTSDGILKGIEQAYRLVTDSGEFFDVSAKHRVLAESGWVSLDQLVSLSSGLHLKSTREDYQANCVEGGYLCDQPLPKAQDNDLNTTPSQDGVQELYQLVYELEGVKEQILQYIHPSQLPAPLSTASDLSRYEGLFELFQAAKIGKSSLSLSDYTQEFHQFLTELASDFQSYLLLQNEISSEHVSLDLLHSYILSEPYKCSKHYERYSNYLLSHPNLTLSRGDLKSLHGESDIVKFYPLYHPPLVGGKRIVCVVPLGLQPIIDLSVSETKTLIGAGICHHNTGKTEAGAYEVTCHATGLYPSWWNGKRFTKPPMIWIGGDTATTCRDIVQQKLLGTIGDLGSGMIPRDSIYETKPRRNVPEAIETIRVKHISGGISNIVIKTYEQGRASWQGTEVDFIWIDEEPGSDVYGEALVRTMTTKGSIILTFTPLSGLTELVINYLENSQETDVKYPKYVTTCGWVDVPHLSKEEIEQMLAATPPNLRDARSKGEPTVGSGRIYPLPLEEIVVDDFKIPKYWRKAYGMDVGWNNTAACWAAWDETNDVMYLFSEHKQGEAQPVVHASAIKARGEWIKGAIDPASRGRSQTDGSQLWKMYKDEGLKIYPANNAIEAGIYEVWDRLSTGRLKIFKSCTQLQKEINLYHRDEKGKIVKKNDHLLDALRYLMLADKGVWSYMPSSQTENKVVDFNRYMQACV